MTQTENNLTELCRAQGEALTKMEQERDQARREILRLRDYLKSIKTHLTDGAEWCERALTVTEKELIDRCLNR